MVTPTGIHHVNFIVRDLDEAMPRFEKMLGLNPFEVVDHALRGARVARTRLGDSWFVLVAPYDSESVPGQFLAEHGEGFFLLSLASSSVANPRDGILDWKVEDLGELHGAQFQLTEDRKQAGPLTPKCSMPRRSTED
jgi:methylmalonyl-CoA/ethylmalonyl-CoA epimerase